MLNRAREFYCLRCRETDERVAAEANRIYRMGYVLLLFGLMLYLWHGLMVTQVATVNELQAVLDAGPVTDPFVSGWCLLVIAVVSVQCFRKGVYSREGRDGFDLVPIEACLIASLALGVFVFVLATFMRAFVEVELMGFGSVNWLDDAVIATVYAFLVFFLVRVGTMGVRFADKRRRRRVEARLDD